MSKHVNTLKKTNQIFEDLLDSVDVEDLLGLIDIEDLSSDSVNLPDFVFDTSRLRDKEGMNKRIEDSFRRNEEKLARSYRRASGSQIR